MTKARELIETEISREKGHRDSLVKDLELADARRKGLLEGIESSNIQIAELVNDKEKLA